jgi:hypothetical protein
LSLARMGVSFGVPAFYSAAGAGYRQAGALSKAEVNLC